MNNNVLKTAFRFVLFASIGLGILYWLYYNMDKAFQAQCALDGVAAEDCSLLDKLWGDFLQVKWFWIGIVLTCYMISNFLRAARWQMLLKPLGKPVSFTNAFWSEMIGYFVSSLIPRTGEIAKPAALSRYEKIPLEQTLGTIAVSRGLDVLCLLIMLGLAFLLEFEKLWDLISIYGERPGGNTNLIIYGLISLIILGGIALVIVWKYRDKLSTIPLYQKIENILLGFLQGIRSIKELEKPGLFIFQTIGIWVMYYFTTYLVFFSFEPTAHLSPSAGLLAFVFGAIGIVIPAPGGLGSYHFLITTALTTFYAINQTDAFSFSMIGFFPVYLCNILLGLIALVVLPWVNRDT